MEQLGQFIINHWVLWLALIAVVILILINEKQAQTKRAKEISPQAAVAFINHDDPQIFDLRDTQNFTKGHIINSVQATTTDFEKKKMEKYKTKPILLVCQRGLQSASLAAKLRQQGFTQPVVLAGGINAWQVANLPLVKGK